MNAYSVSLPSVPALESAAPSAGAMSGLLATERRIHAICMGFDSKHVSMPIELGDILS